MSEFATMTAEANAKQGIIERQARVQEAEAKRDATTNQIKQNQINDAIISNAKAKLEATKLEAEGIRILAEAKAKELALLGEMFEKHDKIYKYECVKVTSNAISNGKLIVSYPTQPLEHVLNSNHFESPAILLNNK